MTTREFFGRLLACAALIAAAMGLPAHAADCRRSLYPTTASRCTIIGRTANTRAGVCTSGKVSRRSKATRSSAERTSPTCDTGHFVERSDEAHRYRWFSACTGSSRP